MSRTARKWILAVGAVVMIAIVVVSIVVLRGGSGSPATVASTPPPDAGDVAGQYLAAWSAGDDIGAAALTDDPAGAAAAFKAVRTSLAPVAFSAKLRQVTSPKALINATWTLGPARLWSYDNEIQLVHGAGGAWRVHFTPAVIHPELGPGDRLAVRGASTGPAVTDRDGKPLMTWQPDGPKAVDPNFAPLVLPGVAQLATGGGKSWAVDLIDPAGKATTLYSEGAQQPKALTTTLSSATQTAAQAAVDGAGFPAMLVAIQPSTGDILAVAQSASVTSGSALTGQYAPGSTFKIATAAAVLQAGTADADTVLPCPGTVQIGQRTIPNDDQFSLPSLPLHAAFAHSCNTTFAQLASQLPPDALAKAASEFGLNADFDIPGLTTEAGKVEPSANSAEQVEAAIGQGKVQASPFGLALMSATVSAGESVTPRLIRDRGTSVLTDYQAPSSSVLSALRSMMREVVTEGTATGLAGSGTVAGKTGTAQFGDGSQANGWFTGYRGDIAFSVLLLGSNSSRPAVSTVAAFLRGV